MRKKPALLVENISEATAACLVTMVQGNLLAIGLGHLMIALQTGVIAGALAAVTIVVSKAHKRWVISLLLGVITMVVDYFVHPGMFGSVFTEAVVTGLGAAVLSFLAGTVIDRVRKRSAASA